MMKRMNGPLVAFVLEYAIALADRSALDLRAPLVGADLLIVGQLASVAPSFRGAEPARRRPGAQFAETLGFGLGAVVIGALVIAVSANQPPADLVVQASSAAAATGVLLLITSL